MPNPVIIGSFGKTFGVRGWIKVNSLTNPPKNILDFKPWLINKNGSWKEVYLEASQIRINNIIVKLPDCNSPEEARNFTNIKIGIWRKQLPKLKINEYYWADLIGLRVINLNKIDFGVVENLIATGANDVLVVIGDRKRLIPYISNVILNVDLAEKIIHVNWESDF